MIECPDELLGKNQASDAEWAIYTALTLYAVHQQGSDTSMNQEKISLGHASARLIKTEDDTDRILKRLNLVVTAVSPEDLAYRLKEHDSVIQTGRNCAGLCKACKRIIFIPYEEYAPKHQAELGKRFLE